MDKRVGLGPPGRDHQKPLRERGVVDLADARVRIRSRGKPTNESLLRELDEIRSLLDQGLSTEAKQRLSTLISNARNFPAVLALARCALTTALEQQDRKSTRLNSSHGYISYAVFCLKKKTNQHQTQPQPELH